MSGWSQAWVTSAENDEEVMKVLVLVESLKRVRTNKQTYVCVGSSVSRTMRKHLRRYFDGIGHVNLITGLKCSGEVRFELSALLYIWTLTFIKECVYLHPDTLVIRNPDDIFNGHDELPSTSSDGSVHLFRPSYEAYEDALENLNLQPDSDLLKEYRHWLSKTTVEKQLGSEYCATIPTIRQNGLSTTVCIIQFSDEHPFTTPDLESNNPIQSEIWKYWSTLHSSVLQDVGVQDLQISLMSFLNKETLTFTQSQEPIAIIGMACRLPMANTIDEFWQVLLEKVDAIRPPPSGRWTKVKLCEASPEEENVLAGFLKCPIDEFDSSFFGIPPAELAFTDPQQRLLLEVIWEAIEDAGIDGHSLKGTNTGIFTGTWTNYYEQLMMANEKPRSDEYRSYTGNSFGATSGRAAQFLGVLGPNLATESGCSSSMVATGLAVKSLQNHECNLALACGVNLLTTPFAYKNLGLLLSPDGHCKTFDEKADGFARGEGCVVLVLKRVSEAMRENDQIYALIRGYGSSQDGLSPSFGTPTVQSEARAIKAALKNAGVHPHEVSYVEAHGTGTSVGDPVEIQAITEVYSENRVEPLVIGSVKTNIGHTESCAGLAGILKTTLALQNDIIPAHLNLSKLNPKINLEVIPAKIPLESKNWERVKGSTRLAGVSSFGITGTNAHLILEEAPDQLLQISYTENKYHEERHILTLSAKSQKALYSLVSMYAKYTLTSGLNYSDLTYSSNVTRAHFKPYRAAILGSNLADLNCHLKNLSLDVRKCNGKLQLCFIFPGEVSSVVELCTVLYNKYTVFRINFDKCSKIFSTLYGIDLKGEEELKSMFYFEKLWNTVYIFCFEYCLGTLWIDWGVKPVAVIGRGNGQLSAAVVAGILELEKAIELLASGLCTKIIQPNSKHLEINSSLNQAINALTDFRKRESDSHLEIMEIRTKEQFVLNVSANSAQNLVKFCNKSGLSVNFINEVEKSLNRRLENQEFLFSKSVGSGAAKSEVQYFDCPLSIELKTLIVSASNEGHNVFLEVGNSTDFDSKWDLSNSVTNSNQIAFYTSIAKTEHEPYTLLTTVAELYTAGADLDWKAFHRFSPYKKIKLPFYPFQRKSYWYEPNTHLNVSALSNPVHPLLGNLISNSSNLVIYSNDLALSANEFLKHHELFDNIIFPAAAYIEICLAVSKELFLPAERECRCLIVNDATVLKPLCLTEATRIQTIVSELCNSSRLISHTIQISSNQRHTSTWLHNFQSCITFSVTQVSNPQPILTKMEDSLKIHINVEAFYDKLQSLGLTLTSAFRSIKSAVQNDKCILAEIELPKMENDYMSSVISIDAMLQSILLTYPLQDEMPVPVKINQFVWHGNTNWISGKKFIRVEHKESETADKVAHLLDSDGATLASLQGLIVFETNQDSMIRAISPEIKASSSFYETCWQLDSDYLPTQLLNDNYKRMHLNLIDKTDNLLNHAVSNKIAVLMILKGLQKVGWRPSVKSAINENLLMQMANISTGFRLLLRRLLEILEEGDYIEQSCPQNWTISKDVPTIFEIDSTVQSLFENQPEAMNQPELLIQYKCLDILPAVLLGDKTVLPTLFPASQSEMSAEFIYSTGSITAASNKLLLETLKYIVENITKRFLGRKVRILEIGAGTGSATRMILPLLQEAGVAFTYMYTDISLAFFEKAQEEFPQSFMAYQTLNIELDPLAQGFQIWHYDIILASHVLHATSSLKTSISHCRLLLQSQGVLVLSESLKPHPYTDTTFGLLDNYWRFTDFDIRPSHPMINLEKWEKVLLDNGFVLTAANSTLDGYFGVILGEATMDRQQISAESIQNSKSWLVFSRSHLSSVCIAKDIENTGRYVREFKLDQVDLKDGTSYENLLLETQNKCQLEGIIFILEDSKESTGLANDFVLKEFFYLIQAIQMILFDSHPQITVITRGGQVVEDELYVSPIASTLWGMARAFTNECVNGKFRMIDLDPNGDFDTEAILSELWRTDCEYQIAYRENKRYLLRLGKTTLPDMLLPLPKNNDRFCLSLLSSKDLSDLQFIPLKPKRVASTEVDVQVRSIGLNFRDIFVVLKPAKMFDGHNSLGLDVTGIITEVGSEVENRRVGDRVICPNLEDLPFPSHIQVDENLTIPLPEHMTFEQGATLPTVFATAYSSLIAIGKLQAGDTVLIHTATGGVGLCAIQLARMRDAEIIATASSERKRAYLKSLKIKHVFNSRDVSFQKGVLQATNELGVNLVLNTLTSPGFKEASLACCANEAQFVEISKLNIFSQEEVAIIRPDIKYTILDIWTAPKSEWIILLRQMEQLLSKKKVQPLPYTRFDAGNIRDALRFLQSTKHIGKIVCSFPIEGGKCPLFNDQSTYLVTGGLSGIGWEVCKWMLRQGARNIILCGRNDPSPIIADSIKSINAQRKHIHRICLDVSRYSECEKLLQFMSNLQLPPLRGIMHSAGCIADGLVVNQTWERFRTTFDSKIYGTWNLHRLTKKCKLEHFVMFSSMVSIFGPVGQSNHAAANSFMDAFAHYRRLRGLPATVINWGQWAEIGIAPNIKIPGFTPFSPQQGIEGLETIMRSQKTQIGFFDGDLASLRKKLPTLNTLLADGRIEQTVSKLKRKLTSSNIYCKFEQLPSEEQYNFVETYVEHVITNILKFDGEEKIDPQEPFQRLGLDSLMMVQLKNTIQRDLKDRVPISVSDLHNFNTIKKLGGRLMDLIKHKPDKAGIPKQDLQILIKSDSHLSEHIWAHSKSVEIKDIRTVLFTGATGTLGPYILHQLSIRPEITKIHCIIRPLKEQTAEARLLENLERTYLKSQTKTEKIIPIEGQLEEDLFGMSKTDYDELARTVDLIVHCAVKNNHMEEYRLNKDDKSDIRNVIVLGTMRILEFAAVHKTKWVFHASSIVAALKTRVQDEMSETWLQPDELDGHDYGGYITSKFISERLVSQAVERGIPCKIFRFPGILGDSKTGFSRLGYNHVFLRFLSYMKMQMMPSLPMPMQYIPVDTCASVSLQAFFADSEPGVINVFNPHNESEQSFLKIAEEFGYSIKIVDFAEFAAQLKKDGDMSFLYYFDELYTDKNKYAVIFGRSSIIGKWAENPDRFFKSRKLEKLVPNFESLIENPLVSLRRDIQYAKDSDEFRKYKI